MWRLMTNHSSLTLHQDTAHIFLVYVCVSVKKEGGVKNKRVRERQTEEESSVIRQQKRCTHIQDNVCVCLICLWCSRYSSYSIKVLVCKFQHQGQWQAAKEELAFNCNENTYTHIRSCRVLVR